MNASRSLVQFTGALGAPLAARLDLPAAAPRAFALFAHCFTCSKDTLAGRTFRVKRQFLDDIGSRSNREAIAERKQWPLERVTVRLKHDKVHAADCAERETREGKIDRIERVIELEENLDETQRARLLEIAGKCPVHRTLHSEVWIPTRLRNPPDTTPGNS
jgi:hypothetical protein